uniref:Fibronectin type-III domain-containing protein n=2 Tax=Clytia hemisphaerica TaxID=252671 RepID=A0A7M5VD99_9CNID
MILKFGILTTLLLVILLRNAHGEDKTIFPHIVKHHTIQVNKDSATVAWSYKEGINSNVDYSIQIIYRVFDPTAQRVQFKEHVPKGAKQATVTNLRSGTPYQIYIHAKYQDVDGPWSTALVVTTTGPRPPRTFYVSEITDRTATLRWTPPIDYTPDDYLITLRNNENQKEVVYPALAHPASEYVLWYLDQDTPYIAFIQSRKNEDPSTNMSMGFRTDSPSVITPSHQQVEQTSVLIRWETQKTRILIARYDVELKDTTIKTDKDSRRIYPTTTNQEVRQISIQDLKPGTLYGYRVRSVYRRNGGSGTWSDLQYFTTKNTAPPPAPTGGKVGASGLTSAQFLWEAPKYNYKILSYQLQYAKWNSRPEPVITTSETKTSYLLSELESGTKYTVKVRAVAVNGLNGTWSVSTTVVTAGPKPVSSVSVTEIFAKTAKISWTLYSNTTADQIKVVIIKNTDSQERSEHMIAGNKTEYTATSLQAFTPYAIEVSLILKGEESSVKKHGLRTAGDLPSLAKQPTKSAVVERTANQPLSTIYYEFDKISGVTVKHYVVRIQGWDVPNVPFARTQISTPSLNGGVRQRVTINDVESGYKYRLTAVGVYADDTQSLWSTATTVVVPGPRPVTAIGMRRITNNDVTVSWQSGYTRSDAMYSKQEYIVTLSKYNDDDTLTKITHATVQAPLEEYEFHSKLSALERYQIEVVVRINDLTPSLSTSKTRGFKADSESLHAPKLNKIERTDNSITFIWQRVPNRQDISFYEIEFESITHTRQQQYKTKDGLADRYTFENLNKDDIYIIKVRAVAKDGEKSDWLSRTVSLKHGVTNKVDNIRTQNVKSDSVTLTWYVPYDNNLKMYEIEVVTAKGDDTKTLSTMV